MKQNFEEPQQISKRSSIQISDRTFTILISVLSIIGTVLICWISLNLQSLTITIAGVTAFVGYKNLRVAQDKLALDQEISKQNLSIIEGKQTTERFSKAIEHLGDDKVDIQLGGIYELEQIAMGSKEYHWTIIEILSSFIRRKSSIQQNVECEKDGDLTVDTAIIVIARRNAVQDPEGKWINLKKVNLAEIEIEKKANFVGADLREVNFSKAKMFEVNLNQANLSQANISGASLIGANLSNANLHGSKLNLADLCGANLDGANLFEVNLSQAKLRQASLIKASINNADLSNTDLREANLSEADLSGTNLCGAKLRRANLSGVDLIKAELKGADLCGADLRGADLGGANLYGADLSHANLSGANLGDSILSGAENLTPEQIKRACYWETAKYELGKLDKLKQDTASDPQEPVNYSRWEI